MATAEPETLTNPLSSEEETNNENRQEIVSLEDYIKHPLQNRWALWFFKNDKSKTWQANLRLISKFDTVEDFWAGAETREGGGMRCRGDLGAAIRQGSSHLPGDGGVAAGRREPEEPLPSTEEGEERFRPPGAGGLAAICRGRSELVSARGAVEVHRSQGGPPADRTAGRAASPLQRWGGTELIRLVAPWTESGRGGV
ncbi:uncharacterized protein LOC127417642 isoform X3 [Myxocyprinus asiaticus]|uniref:uncharacterized protein LOC127417642 isoform X3 n=1 Tax=Myxocyprinus asiaticus TaxID=70543 RepID=UPI002222459D|nr:uncharacterized protein LOC127417642 isoform X3 [Myxocyprinus asiaticus]